MTNKLRLQMGLIALLLTINHFADDPVRQIKVVIVTMFESGESTGDKPGELQFWVEKLPLDVRLSFALGERDLYLNSHGVLAVLVGGGIANASASIMALGMDPRFDFSQSYWLIAGIAGGDPEDVSLGSAVWAKHVVDGDLLYELDGREIPAGWPYGMIPLGSKKPMTQFVEGHKPIDMGTSHFALNAGLVEWAYALTATIKLDDSPALQSYRQLYKGFPNAQLPPSITIGDTLSASTYWHGALLNTWANDWVQLYAGRQANFVTANMEDSGTMTSLLRLARAGRVDPQRILVLRTVSNFTRPPKGKSAVWSKTRSYPGGGEPALKAAYRVGSKVVNALLANWDEYAAEPPNGSPENRLERELTKK